MLKCSLFYVNWLKGNLSSSSFELFVLNIMQEDVYIVLVLMLCLQVFS